MKKRRLITIVFLIGLLSTFGQKKTYRRIIKKEDFIHKWILFEIRNSANVKVADIVEKKILKFTQDSIYITTTDTTYAGKWKLEKGQIQMFIDNSSKFDYKWTVIGYKTICFRFGDDMSRLECFKQED